MVSLQFAPLLAAFVGVLSSIPLPPSEDPWYTAPNNFALARPGDVLRIRSAPGNLSTFYNESSAVYNILYRTTDSHFQPFWAVTTVFTPKHANGTALLSYQIPYNSADVDGSASVLLYEPVNVQNAVDFNDIQAALANGWYVNVPDYNGPLTSFGCGAFEGMATLDSIRAVLAAGKGLGCNARVALWGYSGGTIASENAAELHSTYASELNIAGVALGGLVANVTGAITGVSGSMFAGLVPELTLGLFSQYPDAMEYLLSQLKDSGPYNKKGFLAAKHLSIAEAFAYYAGQDIFAYLKDGADFYNAPPVKAAFQRETYMGFRGIPQVPMFFYHAEQDELVNSEYAQKLFERYCSVGVDVLFERNSVGGHLAEATNGDERALKWLEKVFAGVDVGKGCVMKHVTLNVTDSPL